MKFNKNQKREMNLSTDNTISDTDNRTVFLAFSSENPVVRVINGQEYNEILLHNPENVDLSRLQDKAALLFNHDFDNHIGVIESASIDADHVGRALVRFSSVGMGAEKFEMVREGTLSKVSVGYSILDYRIEGNNLLVTHWYPHEISMVSCPADIFCGVGRSLYEEPETEQTEAEAEAENNDEQPTEQEEQRQEETENAPDENTESTASTSESDTEINTETEEINTSEINGDGEQSEPEEHNDDSAVQEEQAEEDQKRIAEINAISRAFNIHSEITNQAIESGLSIEAFRQQIKNKPIIKDDKTMEFSLNTLIRSIMDGDKNALTYGKNGAVVANADFGQAVRAGVTTTTAKDVIHTDVLYGSFVDILRAESVLKNFPVQMFTGLTSEIAVPKLAGDFTAGFGFISENGVSPEVDANFESVVLKPKTFTGSVPLSRSVVKSCPQVEQIVSQAIVAGSAERLEALILKGIVDAVVAAGKVETVDAYTYTGIVAAQGALGDDDLLPVD